MIRTGQSETAKPTKLKDEKQRKDLDGELQNYFCTNRLGGRPGSGQDDHVSSIEWLSIQIVLQFSLALLEFH